MSANIFFLLIVVVMEVLVLVQVRNLLFLLAIIMLMGISLHLTLAISKITDDMRTLAEEVAIMKALQRQPQGASRATEREQKKP